jgi:murein DD-endopeptidase MepM/ murein hydrolase activator NlpD
LNDDYSASYAGDPKVNGSYFNYRDTLYAVADGTVLRIRDGRPENNGDAHDAPINTLDELGGNYLVLDIGGGQYAFYAHCVPSSFMVREGDVVKEGQPIALLGNSGNSDAPHLHFEITDGPDILFSRGIPFVLKGYIKKGESESGPGVATPVTNSMMEDTSVIGFE